jgi:hypothetical protein
LLIFKKYQVDVKDIICPFQWWKKHEFMFLVVSFLVHHVLNIIVGSQIKIEKIFYLTSILTNLRRCHLQTIFLKITFVSKNWFKVSWIGFKTPFNLVRFIKMDVHFKKRLEEFDNEFEREEMVDMWKFGRKT